MNLSGQAQAHQNILEHNRTTPMRTFILAHSVYNHLYTSCPGTLNDSREPPLYWCPQLLKKWALQNNLLSLRKLQSVWLSKQHSMLLVTHRWPRIRGLHWLEYETLRNAKMMKYRTNLTTWSLISRVLVSGLWNLIQMMQELAIWWDMTSICSIYHDFNDLNDMLPGFKLLLLLQCWRSRHPRTGRWRDHLWWWRHRERTSDAGSTDLAVQTKMVWFVEWRINWTMSSHKLSKSQSEASNNLLWPPLPFMIEYT